MDWKSFINRNMIENLFIFFYIPKVKFIDDASGNDGKWFVVVVVVDYEMFLNLNFSFFMFYLFLKIKSTNHSSLDSPIHPIQLVYVGQLVKLDPIFFFLWIDWVWIISVYDSTWCLNAKFRSSSMNRSFSSS